MSEDSGQADPLWEDAEMKTSILLAGTWSEKGWSVEFAAEEVCRALARLQARQEQILKFLANPHDVEPESVQSLENKGSNLLMQTLECMKQNTTISGHLAHCQHARAMQDSEIARLSTRLTKVTEQCNMLERHQHESPVGSGSLPSSSQKSLSEEAATEPGDDSDPELKSSGSSSSLSSLAPRGDAPTVEVMLAQVSEKGDSVAKRLTELKAACCEVRKARKNSSDVQAQQALCQKESALLQDCSGELHQELKCIESSNSELQQEITERNSLLEAATTQCSELQQRYINIRESKVTLNRELANDAAEIASLRMELSALRGRAQQQAALVRRNTPTSQFGLAEGSTLGARPRSPSIRYRINRVGIGERPRSPDPAATGSREVLQAEVDALTIIAEVLRDRAHTVVSTAERMDAELKSGHVQLLEEQAVVRQLAQELHSLDPTANTLLKDQLVEPRPVGEARGDPENLTISRIEAMINDLETQMYSMTRNNGEPEIDV